MPRKYEPWTNERLDKILEDRCLTRIGEVTYWNEKVMIHCEVCGENFATLPQGLERGSGCPYCYKKSKVGSHRKAKWSLTEVKNFASAHGYTVLQDEYINNREPMKFRDESTGDEVTMTFRNFQARVKGM